MKTPEANGDNPASGFLTKQNIYFGITKREHFAGQIMAARISNKILTGTAITVHARLSVQAADELLKALAIEKPTT